MLAWKYRCKKHIKNAFLCKMYTTNALTQGKIRIQKKKMKIGIRGEMRGLHKMKEDYNLRK